jgi:hypothetical protein
MKENIYKILKNESIKIEDVKEYDQTIQKFLFWLDGVKEFSPSIISEFCEFINQCIKNDTHPIDILLVMGSILNTLYVDDINEIKMLESIKNHIEVLYPDNELNTKIEDLDTLQTIRLGIMHWLKVISNNRSATFIEPKPLSADNALPKKK